MKPFVDNSKGYDIPLYRQVAGYLRILTPRYGCQRSSAGINVILYLFYTSEHAPNSPGCDIFSIDITCMYLLYAKEGMCCMKRNHKPTLVTERYRYTIITYCHADMSDF